MLQLYITIEFQKTSHIYGHKIRDFSYNCIAMETVNTNSFETEVLKSEVPTLVDFGASWCSPCKALKPTLESFAAENKDSLKVVFVDIDDSSELASQYSVISVPTLVLFKNGEMVNRMVGNVPKTKLREFIS